MYPTSFVNMTSKELFSKYNSADDFYTSQLLRPKRNRLNGINTYSTTFR